MKDTPIPAILNNVYRTGESFVAQELPLMMSCYEGGPLEAIYWTFTYQARRSQQGDIDGVLVYAHEVTDQVKARQKIKERQKETMSLSEELAATNEQLRKANDQIQNSNKELASSN